MQVLDTTAHLLLLGKPYHWFDGDGMIHGVHCIEGKAFYSNKWVRTKRYALDSKLGEAGCKAEIGENIMAGINKMMGKEEQNADAEGAVQQRARDPVTGERLGKANTALLLHNGRFFALEEADAPYEISLPAISTIGRHTFDNKLAHPFTAHPKVCPVTRELIFFGYDSRRPLVNFSIADASGSLIRTVPVTLRKVQCPHTLTPLVLLTLTHLLAQLPVYTRISSHFTLTYTDIHVTLPCRV
jgi:carotenoid cleavage dioxygenase